MKTFRGNWAFIVLLLLALGLVFVLLGLQGAILSSQQTPGSTNQGLISGLRQQLVGIIQPGTNTPTATATTVPATATPLPPPPTSTPVPPPPTPLSAATAPTITTATVVTPTVVVAAVPAEATSTPGYKVYGSSLVCAIHVGSITDHGYNQAHHDGLQEMVQRVSGLRLEEVENVPESDAVSGVIDQLVDRGCQIIFGQSFGYLPYLLTAAERYPQVVFLHAGGHELRDNLGTYWANNYEAMYLAGIVAGATSKSGQLGFITAFPIPNILASVNAFELGARRVNPKVTTRLVINQAWVDPTKEAAATNALAAAGVDVVATIIDSPVTSRA